MDSVSFVKGDLCMGGVYVKTRKGIHGIKLQLLDNEDSFNFF